MLWPIYATALNMAVRLPELLKIVHMYRRVCTLERMPLSKVTVSLWNGTQRAHISLHALSSRRGSARALVPTVGHNNETLKSLAGRADTLGLPNTHTHTQSHDLKQYRIQAIHSYQTLTEHTCHPFLIHHAGMDFFLHILKRTMWKWFQTEDVGGQEIDSPFEEDLSWCYWFNSIWLKAPCWCTSERCIPHNKDSFTKRVRNRVLHLDRMCLISTSLSYSHSASSTITNIHK